MAAAAGRVADEEEPRALLLHWLRAWILLRPERRQAPERDVERPVAVAAGRAAELHQQVQHQRKQPHHRQSDAEFLPRPPARHRQVVEAVGAGAVVRPDRFCPRSGQRVAEIR